MHSSSVIIIRAAQIKAEQLRFIQLHHFQEIWSCEILRADLVLPNKIKDGGKTKSDDILFHLPSTTFGGGGTT